MIQLGKPVAFNPATPIPVIARDNLLRTWEDMLSGSNHTVVVCGPAGIGKTTVLQQFANAHPDRTVPLFISAASRWAYDPADLAVRLAEEIGAQLGTPVDVDIESSDPVLSLKKLFPRLRRRAERENMRYYFVLDGLESVPSGEETTRRQILDLLPIGVSDRFRFLLTAEGGVGDLPLNAAAVQRSREFVMSGFDRGDVRYYLDGFGLDDTHIDAVIHATRGIPHALVKVRGLLATSSDPRAVATSLPEAAPELYRLQWKAIDPNNEAQVLALAILAHEPRSRTAEDLADLLGVPAAAVTSALTGFPFLECDETHRWQYTSELDRRFAQSELSQCRTKVHDLFIDRLQGDPDSLSAIEDLPSHFVNAGRLRDLVEYLDAARFARLYETSPSLALVRRRADEGIEAAESLNRDADLLRFVVQKTTVLEIASSATAVSEIRALTAIGDIDTATALAEQTTRVEDRFRLLAAVARARREAGLPDDPALHERLRHLFSQLGADALGEERVDIAVDLLHAIPELAIELVSGGSGYGENSMDWSLAGLVVQAQLSKQDPETQRGVEHIHQKIQDPAAQRLSVAATMLLSTVSAQEALRRANALATTSDRLYVLRHWILANRESPEAPEVLERALDLALQTREHRVNAATFRQLATCLPYISSLHQASYYVDRFDALRAGLEEQGPPEEFFRLQLILARTKWRWDQAAARDRFVEIYNDAIRLTDPVVRTTVIARIAATMSRLDPGRRMDDDLHGAVDVDLREGVEKLLLWSAEHFEVFRGVIQALTISRPEDALQITSKLNTEWRRDQGYREFVNTYATAPTEEIDANMVEQGLSAIADPVVRDETLASFITVLARRALTDNQVRRFAPIFRRATAIRDARERVRICALLAGRLAGPGGSATHLADEMNAAIDTAWTVIDDGWHKLDVGAEAVAALAPGRPGDARRYVEEFNKLKEQLECRDEETARAGRYGLLLSIRAYTGLVRHRLLSPEHQEERLLHAIQQCGAPADQAYLLADLVIRYHFAGAPERAASVAERLADLLQSMSTADEEYHASVVVEVWPALYLGAPGTATTYLNKLGVHDRDSALSSAAWVLLTRVPPGDAFEPGTRPSYSASFDEMQRAIHLMRSIETDRLLYDLIITVVDAADPIYQRRGQGLTRVQSGELIRLLEDLVSGKLPSKGRFITHQGYKVAAEAQVNRLREGSQAQPLDKLVAEARVIANVSDRAYVLAIVAATARRQQDRHRILDEAEQELESIPMLLDRIDRYRDYGSLLADRDNERAKRYVHRARDLLLGGEGESMLQRRRSLIDVAYRVDQEFASSVATAFDSDPAKDHVDKQVKRYELAQALSRPEFPLDDLTPARAIEYARAAWRRLGWLQGGQSATTRPQDLLPLLRYAAFLPISFAYPIVAYFLENAVRRAEHGAADVRNYVAPLYDAVLHGAELAVHTPPHRRTRRPMTVPLPDTNTRVETLLVGPRHRPEAVQRMSAWLAEHVGRPLYVCEPYFYPDDVDLFQLVREFDPDWEIQLISGMESLDGVAAPYRTAYMAAWRGYSSDPPPSVFLSFIRRLSDQKFPVHDRWWLTESGGLHLGTSFNGFGARLSTLRPMPAEEVGLVVRDLDPYFRQRRLHEGERHEYEAFTL